MYKLFTGTIGHVAHGKSTIVKAISGVQTVRFKNELERNITIKLGEYLNMLTLFPVANLFNYIVIYFLKKSILHKHLHSF